MRIITVIFISLSIAVNEIEAAMLYTFSETAAGVELTYSGSLNTSSLNFQGGLGAIGRYVDILGEIVPGQRLYDFQNFRPSPEQPAFEGVSFRFSADNISFSWNLDTVVRRYDASSGFGDTFGFYIFERSGIYVTWMNLPWGYVSGSSITGGVLFAGETLSSMGLIPGESFQIFLPGQQTISGVVIAPADSDGDGVLDYKDQCPDTAPGSVVTEHGCSLEQLVPCAGPATGGRWRNHGAYLAAVKATARSFFRAGLITARQRDATVRAAARSDCGKK